jgi:predicted ATPase
MYLRNIAISNYHTFTYHPQLTLTKGMEFDTDPYTSNVNILIWPNGSGKSNFLDLLTLLCNLHILPEKGGGPLAVVGFSSESNKTWGIKKHPWFESYPTTILAERVIWSADSDQSIIVEYDLDEMVHQIVPPVKEGGTSETSDGRFVASNNFNYHFLTTSRVYEQKIRNPLTITLVQEHLWLIYNPINQSYITSWWAIRHRDDLGSGEKAIVSMIEDIIESNCVWWIVLIDEPELHLHPQYQRHLWHILEILSQQTNSQIILATHSPFFINEHNIENVFRFALRDGHSHIINPVDFRGQEQARVKQILTDGNMSKLFFTDIIIMVEWDTDEYFLHYYIREYFKQHNIPARRYNYELLNIAGKSSLHAWRSFCNQFQIEWSFIGDRDNVISSSPFGASWAWT